MTVLATNGYGTTLTWNTYTVAELTDLGGLDLSIGKVDVTTHDATSAVKEKVPGMVEYGDINIKGFFYSGDTNGQVAMSTDAAARTSRTMVITPPTATGTTLTGTAFITKLKIGEMKLDGAIPFEATLTPSGALVLAISASTGGTFIVTANNGAGTVNPVSAAGTYEYVVNLPSGATSYTVTPTISTSTITLLDATGATQTIITGNASTSLAAPSNGFHTIYLKAKEPGKAYKTYTIHVVETV